MADERYARSDVSAAVNAAADLIENELDLGERDHDLLDLVVKAVRACLDDRGVSFDQMVEDNYDHEPDTVRGWWSAWA